MNFPKLILTNSPAYLLLPSAPKTFILVNQVPSHFLSAYQFLPDPHNYPVFSHEVSARTAMQNSDIMQLEQVTLEVEDQHGCYPFSFRPEDIASASYSIADKRRLIKYFERHVDRDQIDQFNLDDQILQQSLSLGVGTVGTYIEAFDLGRRNFMVVFQYNRGEFYDFIGRRVYRNGGVYLVQDSAMVDGGMLMLKNQEVEFQSLEYVKVVPRYNYYQCFIVVDFTSPDSYNTVSFYTNHIRLTRKGTGRHLKIGFTSVEIWSMEQVEVEIGHEVLHHETIVLNDYSMFEGAQFTEVREADLIYQCIDE